jgi:hypothetical protein
MAARGGVLIALFGLGRERHQRPDALLIGDRRLKSGSFEFRTALPDQIQECGHGYHRGCSGVVAKTPTMSELGR